MRSAPAYLVLLTLAGLAGLGRTRAPVPGAAAGLPPSGAPRFLAASAPVWLPGPVPPAAPAVLPTSTRQAYGPQCSISEIDPSGRATCSAFQPGAQCSAAGDFGMQCSAFYDPATPARLTCSTHGGTGSSCSVFTVKAFNRPGSDCSAFGGPIATYFECSIEEAGHRQFCSAEGTSQVQGNRCSTFMTSAACSLIIGGASRRNFCSLYPLAPSDKRCSTFAEFTDCSIMATMAGACTAVLTPGQCSAFAPNSGCSVMWGAPGTLCRQ